MGTYKVPQNVESEDKILGPLSLKQFIYALIGVGYGILTFAIFKAINIILWVIIGVPPMLALLALGLYQKEDQPLETFVIANIQTLVRPRVRFWAKEPIADAFRLQPPPPKPQIARRDPREVESKLAKLADVVDTRGWSVKQPELQEPDNLAPVIDLKERIASGTIAVPAELRQAAEVTQDDDILSPQTSAARGVDSLIQTSVQGLRQEALEKMLPASAKNAAKSVSGSTAVPSDAIVKLATEGGDLTVAQIAAQARRQSTNPGEGQVTGNAATTAAATPSAATAANIGTSAGSAAA